jgi:hypothetical protein
VVGQVITISLVHSGMGIALPLLPMMAVVSALALTNLGYMLWLPGRPATVTPGCCSGPAGRCGGPDASAVPERR